MTRRSSETKEKISQGVKEAYQRKKGKTRKEKIIEATENGLMPQEIVKKYDEFEEGDLQYIYNVRSKLKSKKEKEGEEEG